jgi:hypothetical protein
MTGKVKKSLIIGSIGLLFAGALVAVFQNKIAGMLMARAFAVSPTANFAFEFSASPDEVNGLKGGGMTWMDMHDTYFRFQSNRELKIKDQEAYELVSPEEAPLGFFKLKFPLDLIDLSEGNDLVVYLKRAARGKVKKCLVINKKTGTHYFRAWKEWN